MIKCKRKRTISPLDKDAARDLQRGLDQDDNLEEKSATAHRRPLQQPAILFPARGVDGECNRNDGTDVGEGSEARGLSKDISG
jgi:hypothetical protein